MTTRIMVLVVALCLTGSAALAFNPDGSHCGGATYTKSLSVSRSSDLNTVTAILTVSASPCGMYGDVQLGGPSPSFRESSVTQTTEDKSFSGGLINISASLPMNYEDGVYTGTAHYKMEDETTWPWSYYPGPTATNLKTLTASPSIKGWVQLYSTSWSPNSGSKLGLSSTFNVTVKSTTACTGTVQVRGTLNSPPSGSSWIFGGATSPTAITYDYLSVSLPGQSTTLGIPLSLSSPNTGTMNAEAILNAVPYDCDVKAPSAGNSSVATLTVTN